MNPSDAVRASLLRSRAHLMYFSAEHQEAQAARVVLAFLQEMERAYVGDYYVEGAIGHLVTMITEAIDSGELR